MSLTFKKLSEAPLLSEIPEDATSIVECNGLIHRVRGGLGSTGKHYRFNLVEVLSNPDVQQTNDFIMTVPLSRDEAVALLTELSYAERVDAGFTSPEFLSYYASQSPEAQVPVLLAYGSHSSHLTMLDLEEMTGIFILSSPTGLFFADDIDYAFSVAILNISEGEFILAVCLVEMFIALMMMDQFD